MNQKMRRFLKKIYLFSFKPFCKNGVFFKMGEAGKYRFDYSFALGEYRYFGGRHNSGFFKWLKLCKGKTTVLDVGAHIGLYSIPASSRLNMGGSIYAFEPSGVNCDYLESHKRFNDIHNIKVFPYLVGEETLDGISFYDSKETSPMNSVVKMKKTKDFDLVVKHQVSLDDFCREYKIAPEVIKIDVEGAEINVLKGAEKTLKRYLPVVFLSIHPLILEAIGQSVDQLREFVDNLGFKIYDTKGNEAEVFKHNEYMLIPKEKDKHEIF